MTQTVNGLIYIINLVFIVHSKSGIFGPLIDGKKEQT